MPRVTAAADFKKFQHNFLAVYLVMVMSDWMQVASAGRQLDGVVVVMPVCVGGQLRDCLYLAGRTHGRACCLVCVVRRSRMRVYLTRSDVHLVTSALSSFLAAVRCQCSAAACTSCPRFENFVCLRWPCCLCS